MTIATEPQASPEDTGPISVRVVDRLGRALAGRGLSRRRFLGRVAVVGSALAVDPIRYALKPGSAYAQVCGTGASCSSGWTAFCCTVNNGANTCPPGSYAAGWWRIDDSPYCMGRARYVIDCNRSPSASCSCRCADGTCDQRRVCCNNFRYGQCNTQVAGVTEVVCRVVTCMTPWEWDASCNRTLRVDNRTRSHNSTCLPGSNATHIDLRYQDLGQSGSILGRATTPERAGAAGGRYRRYENGSIFYRSATGALAVYGAIDATHRSLGGDTSALAYPLTEVTAVGDGAGLHVRYQGGTIYLRTRSATPQPVLGAIDERFRAAGGPTGAWGYPTGTSRTGGGQVVTFEHVTVAQAAGGPVVQVAADVLAAARVPAAGSPDAVGLPVAEEESSGGVRLQRFERGIVVASGGDGLVAVGDDLAARYLEEGGPGGTLGRPAGRPRAVGGGRRLDLERGAIFVGPGTGARVLSGPILAAYDEAGGPAGALGLPTSDVVRVANGQQRASFVGGAIVIDRNGAVQRLTRRSPRPARAVDGSGPDGTAPRTPRRASELS
ncbi:LGFP repeat-containing protein [Egicoccus sp. AB-alg6-2]|uniref:LGFP repeat-containing protein n=1 Tax=Egicoccus sp. AB-alg6-2 TaxID=3242692 RepID=UPI00359E2DF4